MVQAERASAVEVMGTNVGIQADGVEGDGGGSQERSVGTELGDPDVGGRPVQAGRTMSMRCDQGNSVRVLHPCTGTTVR